MDTAESNSKRVIDFSDILPTGKNKAISAEQLKNKIKATDTREVRAHIAAARLSGQLICSGNAGYYQPANKAEIKEFVERMESQAKSTFAVLKTAKEFLKKDTSITRVIGAEDSAHNNPDTIKCTDNTRTEIQEKTPPPAENMNALKSRLSMQK